MRSPPAICACVACLVCVWFQSPTFDLIAQRSCVCVRNVSALARRPVAITAATRRGIVCVRAGYPIRIESVRCGVSQGRWQLLWHRKRIRVCTERNTGLGLDAARRASATCCRPDYNRKTGPMHTARGGHASATYRQHHRYMCATAHGREQQRAAQCREWYDNVSAPALVVSC